MAFMASVSARTYTYEDLQSTSRCSPMSHLGAAQPNGLTDTANTRDVPLEVLVGVRSLAETLAHEGHVAFENGAEG